jgi:hypothetical protein
MTKTPKTQRTWHKNTQFSKNKAQKHTRYYLKTHKNMAQKHPILEEHGTKTHKILLKNTQEHGTKTHKTRPPQIPII